MQLFRLPHLVVMIWRIEIHNDDKTMTVEIVMVIEEIKEVVEVVDKSVGTKTQERHVSPVSSLATAVVLISTALIVNA